MDNIGLAVAWYLVFVFSVILHEAAHGFAAKKLGDPTAYHHGLVTLDPTAHIQRSPFGMLIIPVFSYMLNGWMLGWASAPYDLYWAQRNRKKAALMSLAGPAANLVLVLAAVLMIQAGVLFDFFHAPEQINFSRVTAAVSAGHANAAAVLVSILFSLNLILLVFNLIPLPPLDGSNIFMCVLKERDAQRYEMFLSQPGVGIIGLVIAWQIFGPIFEPIHLLAINLLYPGCSYY